MSGPTKKSFIYFLVDADESKARFKIGHSVDPHRRQKTLAQDFDLTQSWQIQCNRDEVRAIEGLMHRDYAAYRIQPEEIGQCIGMTEWFRIECLEMLLAAVQRPEHAEYLGKPTRIERDMVPLVIQVPSGLKRRMKLATVGRDATLQSDLLWILETYYSGEVIDRERQSAMISDVNKIEEEYRYWRSNVTE